MIVKLPHKDDLNEHKIYHLNEDTLRGIIKEEINEVLGSFDKQYKISDICANEVKKLVKDLSKKEISDIRSGKLDFPFKLINVNSNDVSKIKIRFTQLDIHGQTIGINPDDKAVIIEIGINSAIRNTVSELSDIFAHELMHGNVYLKRYGKNEETYDKIPDYYNKLTNVFNNYYGTIAYNFAHALYACFYQETNALVSQVYSSIMMEIGNSVIDKNTFIDIYRNTNSFMEFNLIITETLPLIRQMDNTVLEKMVILPFKQCGINFNITKVRNECKRLEKVAKDALKKCNRNASLCYNDLLKNKKII